MTEIVNKLSDMEKELETKLAAIRKTRELFAARDASDPASVGALEPVMTDRLRAMFQDGKHRQMKDVLAELKAANYEGPESRVRGAVRRLQDTGELKKTAKGYVKTQSKAA